MKFKNFSDSIVHVDADSCWHGIGVNASFPCVSHPLQIQWISSFGTQAPLHENLFCIREGTSADVLLAFTL
jgi:hypothetical protein